MITNLIVFLYVQISMSFFVYSLARKLFFQTLKNLKVVVNKKKDELKTEIDTSEKYLKLSIVWPVIILLWSYEKIKK